MPLHLQKVAVGIKTAEDLDAWRARIEARGKASHVTRMWPKRADEVLDGGSLYWSVSKKFAVRQRILALERTVVDGVSKCRIVLDPDLVPVRGKPRRPFQGWRYLEAGKAPEDLRTGISHSEAELERTLASLGLL